jgi:hypothetical protein
LARLHREVVQLGGLALALVALAVEDGVGLGEQHLGHLLHRQGLRVV